MIVRADARPAVPSLATDAEPVERVPAGDRDGDLGRHDQPHIDFRDRRRARLAEARRRTGLLAEADPAADSQLVNAIAAADRLWGSDEQWRQAIRPQRGDVHEGTVVEAAAAPDALPAAPAPPGRPVQTSLGGKRWRLPARLGPRRTSTRPDDPAATVGEGGSGTGFHCEQPLSVGESFDVPGPGKPTRRVVGRARSWTTRLAVAP